MFGTLAGRQLARTVTRRPEHKRWSKALFAQVVCSPKEPKVATLPAVQAQRRVQDMRWKAWVKNTHECRTRLEECVTREGQVRARANAQAPKEALVPGSDVLEGSGPRVVVEDARAAVQKAQAHRVLPSERSNQEILGTWSF